MGGINTYVSSTDYTATGGIDRQTLGNGVVNDFAYDPVSNRLDRILTAKPGYLALVDLTYDYDLVGNITTIDDGVRQEERSYQYDFLDRLTYAGVYAGPQMIEERYYTYDPIGNLLSFPRSAWATHEATLRVACAARSRASTCDAQRVLCPAVFNAKMRAVVSGCVTPFH